MLFFEQLDLFIHALRHRQPKPSKQRASTGIAGETADFPKTSRTGKLTFLPAEPVNGLRKCRDSHLETEACALLSSLGAKALIPLLRVEWNPRLRSAAGRAHFHDKLVSLNPRLHAHGPAEIDRTLRHELAHLLAQFRARRRRIAPHGPEWRQACRDLGIADETRCHTLPFPTHSRPPRLLYRCPRCAKDFPRVRHPRRAIACLACCHRYNSGDFSEQYQLRLVQRLAAN